jgi:hypothetical protein
MEEIKIGVEKWKERNENYKSNDQQEKQMQGTLKKITEPRKK